MEPAMMALVGLLLQVTLATESAYKTSAKNPKPGGVDLIISSSLRQLSAAVYNTLSKDRKSSLETVQFNLASLFNDLQEQCQTWSMDISDLAGLNTEARKILGTVLESIYGAGSNKGIPASSFPGPLVNRYQPDPLTKVAHPVPSHRAISRKTRGPKYESYSTNELPCIVCQVKNIQCSYENGWSSCEACRKSKVRCIKEVPSGQNRRISLPSINSLFERDRQPGKSGDNATLQDRSVVDLTRHTEVPGPTIPAPNSYPHPAPKCQKCGTMDNCAPCPGSDGYRYLCEICGHPCSTCELENTTPHFQPPNNRSRARPNWPSLNGRSELPEGDVVVAKGTTLPQHHSAAKKRTASVSEATQEYQDGVKRAKNDETSRKYRVRMAREYEELMMGNEVLEDELALSRRVAGGA